MPGLQTGSISHSSCGYTVTITFIDVDDVFMNPAFCPICRTKFFPASVRGIKSKGDSANAKTGLSSSTRDAE